MASCVAFCIVCLVFSGTLLVAAQTAEQASASSESTDRQPCVPRRGFVHSGPTYDQALISDFPDECCILCNSDPRCRAWSISLLNETCLLKDKDDELVPDEFYISGVVDGAEVRFAEIAGAEEPDPTAGGGFAPAIRVAFPGECSVEEGASFPGGDALATGDAADAEVCCERCSRIESCFSWQFNKQRGRCVLNRNVPDKVHKKEFAGGSMI